MSESSNSAWPFGEISGEEGLDIEAIFKDSTGADQSNPFASPVEAAAPDPAPEAQEPPAEPAEPVPAPNPAAVSAPTPKEPETPAAPAPKPTAAPPAEKSAPEQPEVSAAAENPIAAAFEQKTAENTKKGLLEKPPVFYHKGVKEEIEDPSMTFEELRIRKSEDFTDLEEGKRVSWSVEYCGIRKEIKDPKGTTIISVKETIERSHEFLAALKKSKEKDPCCYVKPKVEMKTKGKAAYKGKFGTLEEARTSDKVICLIPARDGRIYELRKMEQGEFIAPKNNVVDFSEIRAGFTPALPKIPAQLMGQIIAFFRAFMTEAEENEALALIYWDKAEKRFFAYVPKQSVCKEEVEANLHDCPYALPAQPLQVNTFKGERFNQKELEQQLRKSNSFAQMMRRSELDNGAKRPLLPLSISQIGLIGGSGMINGLIECDRPHIIKGRIVKVVRTESEEKFSASGNHLGSEVKETITNKMIFNVLTPNGFKALT